MTQSSSEYHTSGTALVTGASRGLGASIALELGRSGAAVAVNYFERQDSANEICREIGELGGRARAFQADVRDEEQVARMVKEIAAWSGPVDIAVFNATGPQPFFSIEEQTWQIYLQQLEFFVKSPLILTKLILPGMKEKGYGRIIQ
jgi:3-oxoacyl-[acyl-carrier protein] reductase